MIKKYSQISTPIYTYVTRMRPASPGAIPKDGILDIRHFNKAEVGYWSEVDYSRPLSEKELYDFEMREK